MDGRGNARIVGVAQGRSGGCNYCGACKDGWACAIIVGRSIRKGPRLSSSILFSECFAPTLVFRPLRLPSAPTPAFKPIGVGATQIEFENRGTRLNRGSPWLRHQGVRPNKNEGGSGHGRLRRDLAGRTARKGPRHRVFCKDAKFCVSTENTRCRRISALQGGVGLKVLGHSSPVDRCFGGCAGSVGEGLH